MNNRIRGASFGGTLPGGMGGLPRSAWRSLAGALGLAAGLVACAAAEEERVVPPVVVGMTPAIAPIVDEGEDHIVQIKVPVRLPLRAPSDADRAALPRDVPPYPRGPYLLADDVRMEIRFTLSNLDDEPRTVELLIDPWNEFVRYDPGIVVTNRQAVVNFSGYQRMFVLAPKSRTVGTITADDTRELAIDLATTMSLIATAAPNTSPNALINHAFNRENRSSEDDPVLAGKIPRTIAGLTGFDIGLRATAPGNVALEALIDLKDLNGNRVDPDGKAGMGLPPRVLRPPPPPDL